MKKVYLFNNAVDMISLAQEIQSCVYWEKSFFDDKDNQVSYKYFWEYCEAALEDECDGVEISDDTVRFIKTMV